MVLVLFRDIFLFVPLLFEREENKCEKERKSGKMKDENENEDSRTRKGKKQGVK